MKIYHFSKDAALIIYIELFYVVALSFLSFLCWDVPFSIFFQQLDDDNDSSVEERNIDAANEVRKEEAKRYWNSVDAGEHLQFYKEVLESKTFAFAILIITSVRRDSKTGEILNLNYLSQVAAELDKQIFENGIKAPLIMCKVQGYMRPHTEAEELEAYIPLITRQKDALLSYQEKTKQERQDYVACLNEAISVLQVDVPLLVLQDDALPHPHALKIIEEIISQRFKTGSLDRDVALVKLFYPEKWQGYGLNLQGTLELLAFGLLGAFCHMLLLGFFKLHNLTDFQKLIFYLVGCSAFILTAVIYGRPNIIELRRSFWYLWSLVPAPGCCIPAVVYSPHHIAGIINYCSSDDAEKKLIDLCIDSYVREVGARMYLIEPNAFKHIGWHSSLGDPKSALDFL